MGSKEFKNLDGLMDGGVSERFNAELQKVWANVFDLRTDPTQKRKITLTFTFQPSQNRDAATMSYDVKTTLASPMPMLQTVLMHQRDDGSVIVTERTDQVPGQIDMSGNEQPLPKVIKFDAPEEAQ